MGSLTPATARPTDSGSPNFQGGALLKVYSEVQEDLLLLDSPYPPTPSPTQTPESSAPLAAGTSGPA